MAGHEQHAHTAAGAAKVAKAVVDTGAAGIPFAAWAGVLPEISAAVSLLWALIRVWETDTVQRLCGRRLKERRIEPNRRGA